MTKLKSEGQCLYCRKMYTKQGITRHLSTHLKRIAQEKLTDKKSYHIRVTGAKVYFLHLLIHADSSLETLDSFLRDIWLDCCGHMSSFEIKSPPRKSTWAFDDYENYEDYEDFEEPGINKNTQVGELFKKGLTINYEYDFGSTTYLEIDVLDEYVMQEESEVVLLSRNAPLKIVCDLCKEEPAEVVCFQWHYGEAVFCQSCKSIHGKTCSDFLDYGQGMVVNSPRMGVCGYEGGTIDIERDGAWQK